MVPTISLSLFTRTTAPAMPLHSPIEATSIETKLSWWHPTGRSKPNGRRSASSGSRTHPVNFSSAHLSICESQLKSETETEAESAAKTPLKCIFSYIANNPQHQSVGEKSFIKCRKLFPFQPDLIYLPIKFSTPIKSWFWNFGIKCTFLL